MNIKKIVEDLSKERALDEAIDEVILEMAQDNPRLLLALKENTNASLARISH